MIFSLWTDNGAMNSKPVFEAFEKSLKKKRRKTLKTRNLRRTKFRLDGESRSFRRFSHAFDWSIRPCRAQKVWPAVVRASE